MLDTWSNARANYHQPPGRSTINIKLLHCMLIGNHSRTEMYARSHQQRYDLMWWLPRKHRKQSKNRNRNQNRNLVNRIEQNRIEQKHLTAGLSANNRQAVRETAYRTNAHEARQMLPPSSHPGQQQQHKQKKVLQYLANVRTVDERSRTTTNSKSDSDDKKTPRTPVLPEQ